MDNIETEEIYKLEISKSAKKELELIKKSATPSVEQLKGKGGIGYSRELSKKDRVVYVVLEEEKTVVISQFLNHYEDK